MVSEKVAISTFERKAPRQNSIEARKVRAVLTDFVILFIAPQILFSFRIPKYGILPSFLIAVSSHDIYVHLRIFSYRLLELGLAVKELSHVKKSLLMYFDPEGPCFSEKLTHIVFAKFANFHHFAQ